MIIKDHLTTVKDFPKKGVDFADITSLIQDGKVYKHCIDEILEFAKPLKIDKIVGPESRGFITGCPVAYGLQKGFVPVRKPGKLPREVLNCKYTSEYETSYLQIHKDDIYPGDRILIVDDVLATGGTIKTIIKMIQSLGAEVVGIAFLLEIKALNGRQNLEVDQKIIKVLERI